MSLELRKNSRWWYGVFQVNGQRTVINLGVPITGKRPRKRTLIGDDEFERSRGRAMEAYEKQRRRQAEDRTGEKALVKLAEMKTGREVKFPKLADLPAHWAAIPRRKAPDVLQPQGSIGGETPFAAAPAVATSPTQGDRPEAGAEGARVAVGPAREPLPADRAGGRSGIGLGLGAALNGLALELLSLAGDLGFQMAAVLVAGSDKVLGGGRQVTGQFGGQDRQGGRAMRPATGTARTRQAGGLHGSLLLPTAPSARSKSEMRPARRATFASP